MAAKKQYETTIEASISGRGYGDNAGSLKIDIWQKAVWLTVFRENGQKVGQPVRVNRGELLAAIQKKLRNEREDKD
jgi:hypothetical protein